MEITRLEVYRREKEGSRLKAFVDFTLDDCLAIRGAKIIEGNSRLFVSMPGKLNKDGKPVPLTKKEMETFHNVANKVFGNLEDKTLFVLDLMNKGQIKKEEVGEKLEELTQAQSNYPKFLKMAERELGFKVYRSTQISRDAF